MVTPTCRARSFLGVGMLTVNVNADRLIASLGEAQRAHGFAAVVAMTRTGQRVVKGLSEHVSRIFDRPTPTTVNAFFSQPATKSLAAVTVGIKDFLPKGTPAAKYLQAQIFGGVRAQKRSERALMRAGVMGNRGFWVPGPGVKLNAYGNVAGATITRILSALRASPDPTQNVTASSARKNLSARQGVRFFLAGPGSRLAPGVWQAAARGRRLVPVLLFVTSAGYRPRFRFFEVGPQLAQSIFPEELAIAIGQGFNRPR